MNIHSAAGFDAPERKYMERALQLAAYGAGFVSPNPMVGAVIVAPGGRIIGQGWHRRFGGPHAEVNAVASVSAADERLLPLSTIYVTLEPCSHYGKTPPCSLLLIEKGIGRVIVGSPDPFPLVSGRGIKMLREAGIEIVENFMRQECDHLNRRFLTAHTLQRPYIQLKWAQSADGFMASRNRDNSLNPIALSTPLSTGLMHAERALADAILVGTNTVLIDNPTLTTRLRPGNSPRPVTFSGTPFSEESNILQRNPILLDPNERIQEQMSSLYRDFGITSLMVEGGSRTLERFLEAKLFDEIRLEITEKTIGDGLPAPALPAAITLTDDLRAGKNLILTFRSNKR